MKKTFFIACLAVAGLSAAQIPTGYYDGAAGLTGQALKTKLSEIITNGHQDKGYNWTVFASSDRDKYYENDNTVLDIYSEKPNETDPYNYIIGDDQCGNYSGEGSCYNREHTIPKSTFNDATPMHDDYHHLLPTDGKVNGMRSNYPYGEVGSATWTSENGSKLGSSSLSGYSGTVFEPIDEFKGDIARIYFYFVTRYQSKIPLSSFQYAMWDKTNYKNITEPFLTMLIRWHQQDPVSQKEIDRNNAVYNYQFNRNPYVDHPEWVAEIFGTVLAVNDSGFSKNYKIYPNPVKSGNTITVQGENLAKFQKAYIFNLIGQMVQEIDQPFKNGNTITLKQLPKGVYILKTNELNTKFVVE
ncbi:MAG: endonuclease [Bergeyella sp.]